MNRKRIERDRKIELVSVDLARPGRLVTTFLGFSARETLAWVRREKRMFPSYRATPVFIQHENQSSGQGATRASNDDVARKVQQTMRGTLRRCLTSAFLELWALDFSWSPMHPSFEESPER